MKRILTLCLAAVFVSPFCSTFSLQHQRESDGVHSIRAYQFNPSSDIVSRIVPIPEKYLSMIKNEDRRSDYENYTLSLQEKAEFSSYLPLLPPENSRSLKRTTVAVYFVKNFIGAGMADFITGDGAVHTLFIINPAVFKSTISEWITYRENSGFIPDGKTTVKVECGGSYTALLYVLIHESSHIMDYEKHITPYVEPASAQIFGKFTGEEPFWKGVWGGYSEPVESFRVDTVGDLAPYGLFPASVSASRAGPMVQKLAQTPFVTLYGARCWPEDFAESVTVYHLTQKMKLSYRIAVIQNGKEIISYEPEKNSFVQKRNAVIGRLCGDTMN